MSPKGGKKALTKWVGIRMSDELGKKLGELAKRDRRALADYCRIVLEDHAAKHK